MVADRQTRRTSKFAREAGKRSLGYLTEKALQQYFSRLDGHTPSDVYDLVMREVEPALLRTVLQEARGNQSRAAQILGINRGTLRKKLRTYRMLD